MNITGERIVLRCVEPEDLDIIYIWENETSHWECSDRRAPYSKHQIRTFIDSQQGLERESELRLMICLPSKSGDILGEAVGIIDIFEYDHFHHRAGVGIVVDSAHRKEGVAAEALLTLERYLRDTFEMHQIWCNVSADNTPSLRLFEKCGYTQVGTKKEWIRRGGGKYIDEILLQKLL